ncbi:nuclear transport factor 2 family protein [Pseudorhodoplanes sinuspersici]|nr:nuclear transport factor 2 family protein [Pseudorhodoplanes sinuspersici]RKE65666.1 hypothetical protein DFP91_5844 [Pseudorhodoplanes sinuspersici]
MKHWFSDLYTHIDAMRLEDFVAGLTPDVEVVVGTNPAMKGREQVKAGIRQLFSAIDGIQFSLRDSIAMRLRQSC